MSNQQRRSASEIRVAFKTMTVQELPYTSALGVFDHLWDEANRAAVEVMGTSLMAEYVALLKEMEWWFQAEAKKAQP
ncbi:hypothetical protein SAMN05414139_07367 [Burkholderia sp. D7]|jgi:hypothetical protein|nr:hypothetical protein SAMN05414139_07367 [Burkholderia sp. D7]